MALRRIRQTTLLLLGCCFASSPLQSAPLQLQFTHTFANQPLRIDSLRYTNEKNEDYSSTRLSYLISEVSLQRSDGSWAHYPDAISWIDATRSRKSLTLPAVASGSYTAVKFHLGVNQTINHSDPASYTANHPLNPNLTNLHWDWQGGYIFMALEGHWRTSGAVEIGGYAYHFANDHNLTAITLPAAFEVKDESIRPTLHIALDLQRVLRGLSFAKDGATTHSQPGDPVAATLQENLPAAFRLLAVDVNAPQLPAQAEAAPIDLPAQPTPYPITLPIHIPIPKLPLDNPIITERVTLGEKLFHEAKLSRTNAMSCASCHQGDTMSDPRRFSPGVDGKTGPRHAMPLFNLAWKNRFFWDGRAPSLREQVLVPIADPLEMDETLVNVVQKLQQDPAYPPLFAQAFGSGDITPENIGLALENFLLTRLSLNSKIDQIRAGKATFTPEEQRGFELFFTESEPRLGKRGADCFHCHGGALFTDHQFHNNGLPGNDLGLFIATGIEADKRKFSTPSLRNISQTAPYMHDGRFETLEEVIDHYNSSFERSPTLDPNLAKHPDGLNLTDADKKALLEFLKAL